MNSLLYYVESAVGGSSSAPVGAAKPPSQSNPAIVVGHGLAGLVCAYELAQRHIPVLVVDQENEACLGGQAFWSLGGLFCVDSAEQRRYGVHDSRELALADWMSTAGFDRLDSGEDYWPRRWAEAFVDFAADEMESYVKGLGIKFANLGWAERGDGRAEGHGNSVPRFHLTWGTGPQVVKIFSDPVKRAEAEGVVEFKYRHMVTEIIKDESTGRAIGVRGKVLAPSDDLERGIKSSREEVGDFEFRGRAVVIASGGIGGNVEAVKRNWPIDRLGPKIPDSFVIGVPAHVDGKLINIAENSGANLVNTDRMWHYTEGLSNWDPIWPGHGIRVLPGPSSLWLDAAGVRLPPFLFPGSDTLATLKHICATGYSYTWFLCNKRVVMKEFGLSGSEQNPDVTGKSVLGMLRRVLGTNPPVQAFLDHGEDFVVRPDLESLVEGMNELAAKRNGPRVELADIRHIVEARDLQAANAYSKDAQMMLAANARSYWPDSYSRVVKRHRLLDPEFGPLVAVRMNILTRKTLGGIETNLDGNVMREDKTVFPGLFAAGEASGFGGGGVHGYRSLEGTFLGGCIFSGKQAAKGIAKLHGQDRAE